MNKICKKLAISSAIALSALSIAGQANAIPYNSGGTTHTVYKTVENGNITVYLSGSPYSSETVGLGYVDKVSTKYAGSCGEIKISASSLAMTPTIQVNNSTITLSGLSTQLLPTCVNGTFNESRPNNFKTPTGDLIIVGQTPGSSILLNIPKDTIKTVNLNACGFGTMKNSSTFNIPDQFTVDGTTKILANIPDAGNPPKCTNGVGYRPSTWPSN